MNFFWDNGPLYVKDILDFYPNPKPHFNTVSTMVRMLEEKGFVGHESIGKGHLYRAILSREEFSKSTLKGVIGKYFENSYLNAVSSLVYEEKISLNELKTLIVEVERAADNAPIVELFTKCE